LKTATEQKPIPGESAHQGAKTLTINEIYHSIQGESTWAGQPCVFVRLTFCDLRCTYCDTEYAFYEGKKQSLDEIVGAVPSLDGVEALVDLTAHRHAVQIAGEEDRLLDASA
jgi:hypothetical protein